MLRPSIRLPGLRGSVTNITASRTVYVMSYEKRKKTPSKAKSDDLKKWAEKDNDRIARKEHEDYARKLKELKELSKSMAAYLKRRSVREEEVEKLKSIPLPSETEAAALTAKSAAALPSGVPFNPKNASLATSMVSLPESIKEKLGLAVKYLVSRENQNWSLVLHQLNDDGGLQGIPEKDVRKMVYAIPRSQLRHVFPQIESLLASSGIQLSPKIVNCYLKSMTVGNTVNETDLKTVEKYSDQLRLSSEQGKLSRDTYEVLVEAYGKAGNVEKMNDIIKEMKTFKLSPSLNVYSNVLSTVVYKTRDHKQAVQLFDLMKFLAGSMSPSTREYQDIIVSYVNNDDIEKALDLYQEMISGGISLSQNILVALARGCMSREPLRVKAWDFIFEIYNYKWEPTVQTLEYILYLAAKDGDLALARAFYQQLNVSEATSPRSFSFLFLAYTRSTIGVPVNEYQPLAITAHEKGRNFRRNILDLVDFSPKFENAKQAVPFLPKVALTEEREVLAELSAIMAHALMVHPGYVNIESVNTFMNIAANMGSLEEFIERYNEFTFLDKSGVNETRTIIEPEILESLDTSIMSQRSSVTKSPILSEVLQHRKNSCKVPRNTITYLIALKAAAKHHDYSFAQSIWSERGTYRKSNDFKSLPRDTKDKLDFSFASGMVNCLTDLKLLDDALAILVSTEYQFKWTWKELRKLYTAAVDVGHTNVTKTVRGVVKRAQVTHEGKIRKKDYKRYIMERGY